MRQVAATWPYARMQRCHGRVDVGFDVDVYCNIASENDAVMSQLCSLVVAGLMFNVPILLTMRHAGCRCDDVLMDAEEAIDDELS